MSQLQTRIPTDTWVAATWDEFMQAIASTFEPAKGYHYNGQLRLEAMLTGPEHAGDHSVILVCYHSVLYN